MTKIKTTFYSVLRPLMKAGVRLFHNKIEVVGLENIPTDKPVIIIGNHQNAMLDPVVLCVFIQPQLHWLTRSDVFKKGLVDKMLRNLNMLPVYRERDNIEDLHGRNNAIFEICFDRLKHGAMVSMFPEGTHRGKKQLFPFKKGLARVAFGAYETGVRDLHIVPVGLDYTDHYHSGGDLLVRVGKPVALEPYVQDYLEDNTRALTLLVQAVRHALSKEMIDIHPEEFYERMIKLESHVKSLSADDTMNGRLNYFNKFHVNYCHNESLRTEMETLLSEYEALSEKMRISVLNRAPERTGAAYLAGVPIVCSVGFLLSLPVIALFLPLHIIAERFIAKNIQDPLFPNSIRIVFWTFGGLLLSLIFAVPLSFFIPLPMSYPIGFFGLLLSGFVGIKSIFAWRNWKLTKSVHANANTNPQLWNRWLELRAQLRQRIDAIK